MPTTASYQSFRLYQRYGNGSLRINKFVSRAQAKRMIGMGLADDGVEQDGVTPCFLLIEEVKAKRVTPLGMYGVEVRGVMVESESTFTQPEVTAIAGRHFRHGRSRTASMTEAQRQNRKDWRGKRLPAEDIVEKATNKERAWAEMPSLVDRIREVAVA